MSAVVPITESDPLARLEAVVAGLTEEVRSLSLKLDVLMSCQPTAKKAVDPSKALLSPKEAARILGIDRKTTLKDLVADGHLTTVPGSRGVRIPRSEIDKLLESGIPTGTNKVRKLPRKKSKKVLPSKEALLAKIHAIEV